MEYPFDRGPYLEAALLCEKVLQEVDGVKSCIRIFDRIIRQKTGPAIPVEMEPFEQELCLFIRFKSGSARGPRALQLKMVKPSGESPAPITNTLIFEGEDDRGVDMVVGVKVKFDQVGLYWFWVILDSFTLTRIPLRIVYIPQFRQNQLAGGNP